STSESIQAGVFFGFAGQVEKIVSRFREELGPETRVVATGGLAELIAPETDCIDVVDLFLTLEGLRLLWQGSASHPLRSGRARSGRRCCSRRWRARRTARCGFSVSGSSRVWSAPS